MAEAPGSLRDGEIARAGSCNFIPSGNDIETWKRQRKATRKQVTTACRQIDSLIISHGSRGSIMGLIDHLGLLSSTTTRLHTDLLNAETDKTENERQDAIHLRYIQQIGETRESARQYLESRANEPPSEIRVIAAQPVYSLAPSLIGERPEVAGAAELAVAQQRAHEARMQADAARAAAEEAERDLQRLSIDDRESFSSAHYYNPIATRNVADWLLHPRTKFSQPPATNVEAPDDWIDAYCSGTLPPTASQRKFRSTVAVELDVFHGKSLEWFTWIDLFRALVHDTANTPGEKLAVLKRYLRGNCLDVIYGLGGGKPAYMEALTRLKQTCGRRDVMRAAHLQALDQLEIKQDPATFKRFAEKVRTHLFDLSRIGETSSADQIERVCQRLSLHDRLAWNEGRRGQIEHRSLNAFGSWLCNRASAYQNAYTLAAEQHGTSNTNGRFRQARTHQSSSRPSEEETPKKPSWAYCFKCGKEHRLADCEDFKAMTVGERVTFCMRHRLCFSCFGTKHSASNCTTKRACRHQDCPYSHHPLLHDSIKVSTNKARSTTARMNRQRVALGMMRLKIQAADGTWQEANVFVDEGSDSTLMRSAFATSLKIQGTPQILEIDGAGGVVNQYRSRRIQFQLRTETDEIVTLESSTMKVVASPTPVTDWNRMKKEWAHLRDLPTGEVGGRVDLLIGIDHIHLLGVKETREGKDYEPIASRTRLGWIIRGVTNKHTTVTAVRACTISGRISLEDVAVEMRRFCDSENFGTESQARCLSPDDNRALSIVKERIRKLDTGYEVPIIWREGEPNLHNNRLLAENRLKSLLRRFDRNPKFEEDYRRAMQKTFDQGYASRLSDPASAKYFLAHHGVYKGSKLRVVFDAAAPFRGKSLNDAILSGPALQPALAAVISRFRQEEVAWASDIEAMFSRFRLASSDADYFCFLWRDKETDEPTVCRMNRLPFGASCSPFVAIYAVRQIVKDAGVAEHIVTAVQERMYVDDYLSSAPSVVEALSEATAVKAALANADLNLQRWISNSREFVLRITTEVPMDQPSSHPLSGDAEEKVLGVVWNTHLDTLGFKVANFPDTEFTRMALVSNVASVFDPLGTTSPLIVRAKIRLRELGLKGLSWTDAVAEDDQTWWNKWFVTLKQLNSVEMPRCLFPDGANIVSSELHTFCDASEEAYAAVIYIRNVYSDGRVIVRQARAANKLAPRKVISVPKLELNAALLGSRLAVTVQSALTIKIKKRRFWTDSSTVRNWIRATAANHQVFVSNRVGEIQTITESEEWRFVPGILNPADAATRSTLDGKTFPTLWIDGPNFLVLSEDEWPVDLPWMVSTEEIRMSRVCQATNQSVVFDWTSVEVKPSDVAALSKLDARFLDLVRRCQSEVYAEELQRIKKGKPLHTTSSLLALAPVLDPDGILRLGGRASRAKLPYDQLHPPLLPGKHPFSKMIIGAFHEHLKHAGTDFLLTYIRQHFWITGGREAVKKARRDCVICRRNRAKPGEQYMADLPESRLDAGSLPFTRTAVDLFSPFDVSLYRNRTAKLPSLSTPDFLLSLRKFIAMYRKPAVIHSDNGTNFVGAERELREAVEPLHASEGIPEFMKDSGIEWTFQPPRTPHFGGTHESLVKSTKRALYRALEQEGNSLRYPSEDLLRTLLYEVAGLLNTRPLTYAISDPADFRPLTPNDFMNRSPTAYPPAGTFGDAPP
ncbi:uncharacterized protein LOC123474519 [Daphnia magna]|uniref:uncharacterized protein LOC123474519 n=1 Tax=Daphnia magna TaxID=35525 RepID=UPI001E1BAC78|nr:uncharacterized protein LOC123474519 [Daphnia magna]